MLKLSSISFPVTLASQSSNAYSSFCTDRVCALSENISEYLGRSCMFAHGVTGINLQGSLSVQTAGRQCA